MYVVVRCSIPKGIKGFQKGHSFYGDLTKSNYFQKGRIPWNKGKRASKEHKRKLKESHLGQIAWNKGLTKEADKRVAKYVKLGASARRGKPSWNKGKHPEYMQGKNHPQWQGGKSFEPYSPEFNNRLKEQIRKRDQYRCQECFRHQDELYSKTGRKYKLHIHHIDYNKKNNKEENLISLCRSCHAQTNFGREDWTRYFQENGSM